MVAEARVSFTVGAAKYQLDGSRRDDETVALDISLREGDEPQEQVIGGLLVATPDLPLMRAALDRVLREAEPAAPKAYSVAAIRKERPAAYARWTPEEEERLLSESDAGRTVDELAELLGRQPGGIRSRLQRHGRLDNTTGSSTEAG